MGGWIGVAMGVVKGSFAAGVSGAAAYPTGVSNSRRIFSRSVSA
ncbi:hypothetical protein MCELHM10_00797 [Paracoccaceae bacterium]|jgi:hypothetical protein